MQIIPVIDLMHGQVVHARMGQRQHYQPLQSLLSNSSMPMDIIKALLKLYPFECIYIADIDAIQGTANHLDIILEIIELYPSINFWLDCGIRQINHRALHGQQNIRPVIGSENLDNFLDYRAVSASCVNPHILSLDSKAGYDLGADELHYTAKYWPDDIICMDLNQVGREQGVNTTKLKHVTTLNLQRSIPSRLYAAGGIRHIQDCYQLKKLNFSGALIATALHNKTITQHQIAALNV